MDVKYPPVSRSMLSEEKTPALVSEMKADFICGSETETSVSSADTKPPSAFLCANETSQVCTVTDVA